MVENPLTQEGLRLFALESLIKAARAMAATEAQSYRNFKVGCAMLARNPQTGRYSIFLGANRKLSENDPERTCAERDAFQKARRAGYTEILVIAVAGDVQPDDESGVTSKTLHPCGTCRRDFAELPGGERILFVTVRRDGDVIESHTFGEIFKKHNGNNH